MTSANPPTATATLPSSMYDTFNASPIDLLAAKLGNAGRKAEGIEQVLAEAGLGPGFGGVSRHYDYGGGIVLNIHCCE